MRAEDGTGSESCSVMQWGINFTGRSLQFITCGKQVRLSGGRSGPSPRAPILRETPNQIRYFTKNYFILSDIKYMSS
jgi:hypothetical protein